MEQERLLLQIPDEPATRPPSSSLTQNHQQRPSIDNSGIFSIPAEEQPTCCNSKFISIVLNRFRVLLVFVLFAILFVLLLLLLETKRILTQ